MNKNLLRSVLFLASVATTQAAVVYEETFNNSGTGNANISTVGWNKYFGATAGNPAGNEDWNSYASSVDKGGVTASDVLFLNNGATANATFAITDTSLGLASPVSVSDITSVTWSQGNSNTAIQVRLMVQVGGSWYATNTAFTNSAVRILSDVETPVLPDVSKSFTFTTAASSWRLLTLTPGVEMSISASAITSDLSGNITGVGFLVQHPASGTNQSARFDTLQINATSSVPEPSTFALLAGLAGLGLAGARRQTRAPKSS